MIRTFAAVVASAAVAASAQTVEFFDNELGLSGGSSLSQSFTKNSLTMTVSTTDGMLANIAAPAQFAGLWLAQGIDDEGTYTIDFGGLAMTVLEFEFDAASNSGGGNPEVLDQFAVVGATPSVSVFGVSGMNVAGTTIADLVLTSIIDDGQATIRFESITGFTSLSFRHTQDPSQNGLVIERVFADVIPAPTGAGALALAGLAAARRRR